MAQHKQIKDNQSEASNSNARRGTKKEMSSQSALTKYTTRELSATNTMAMATNKRSVKTYQYNSVNSDNREMS